MASFFFEFGSPFLALFRSIGKALSEWSACPHVRMMSAFGTASCQSATKLADVRVPYCAGEKEARVFRGQCDKQKSFLVSLKGGPNSKTQASLLHPNLGLITPFGFWLGCKKRHILWGVSAVGLYRNTALFTLAQHVFYTALHRRTKIACHSHERHNYDVIAHDLWPRRLSAAPRAPCGDADSSVCTLSFFCVTFTESDP
jgi:hypothetical protein